MKRLEVSGAVRPLYGSLGVKGLNGYGVQCYNSVNTFCQSSFWVKFLYLVSHWC